jgi:hypothetical protein
MRESIRQQKPCGVLERRQKRDKGLSPRHGRIGVAFGCVGRLRSDDGDVCRGGWYRVKYWIEWKKQLLARFEGCSFNIGIDASCEVNVGKVNVKM